MDSEWSKVYLTTYKKGPKSSGSITFTFAGANSLLKK